MSRAKIVGLVAAALLVGALLALRGGGAFGGHEGPRVQLRFLDLQGKEVSADRGLGPNASPADLRLSISVQSSGDVARALLFLLDDRGRPVADYFALTPEGSRQSITISLRQLWPLPAVLRAIVLVAPGDTLKRALQASKRPLDREGVRDLFTRARVRASEIQFRVPGVLPGYDEGALSVAEERLARGEFSAALALVDSLAMTVPEQEAARAAGVAAEAAFAYGRTALARELARKALVSPPKSAALHARLLRLEILAIAEGSESTEPPAERDALRQTAPARTDPVEQALDAALDLRLAVLHDRFSREPPRARDRAQELLRLAGALKPEQQLGGLATALCQAVRIAAGSAEAYDASLLQAVTARVRASSNPAAIAGCAIATGDLFKWRSQWADSEQSLAEALRILAGKDLPREQREAWFSSADLAARRADFVTAFEDAQRAARWLGRLLSLETDSAAREQLLINTLGYYGSAERFGALANPSTAVAAVAVAESGKGSALAALIRGAASHGDDSLSGTSAAPSTAALDDAFSAETARIRELSRALGAQDAALSYTLLAPNPARHFELAIGVVTREQVTVTLVEQPDAFLTDVTALASAVEQNDEEAAKLIGQRLYGTLLAPVAGRLAGKDRLFVSPHLRLHTLPWNALHDGIRFLVHRFAFSRSLPLLIAGAETREQSSVFEPNAHARWLIALNPRHAQHESLPGFDALSNELRRRIPSAHVLGPNDATAERLTAEIGSSNVMLFAGHANYDAGDPLSSALFTTAARAESMPSVWPSDRLEARTLLRLERRLDLAILLGCETARLWRGTSSYGDEAVGIARAFLLTGARNVIGTLWPVLDRDAEDFLRAFVSIESKQDVVRRVQQANRCLADHRCANRGIAAWASLSVESR